MAQLATDPHVAEYQKQFNSLKELHTYSKELHALKSESKVTGNVLARGWKSFKSANKGGKLLDEATKVAREGEKMLQNIDKMNKITRNITKNEKRLVKLMKNVEKNGPEITKLGEEIRHDYMTYVDEASKMFDMTGIKDVNALMSKSPDELAKLFRDEFKNLPKGELNDFIKSLKDVHEAQNNMNQAELWAKELVRMEKELKEFKKGTSQYEIMSKSIDAVRKMHINEVSKVLKAGNKLTGAINKISRIKANLKTAFRYSTRASTIRDYLFHSSLRNASRIAQAGESLAVLHFVLGLIGDFWDWTDVSSKKFTNDISMKPYLLLSADDIDGQDNEVNYGMWLMWSGDSTSPEDDDAAYSSRCRSRSATSPNRCSAAKRSAPPRSASG